MKGMHRNSQRLGHCADRGGTDGISHPIAHQLPQKLSVSLLHQLIQILKEKLALCCLQPLPARGRFGGEAFACSQGVFQVAAEAFQRGLKEALKNKERTLLDMPLQAIVQEKLAPETAFWAQLFEKKLPHPLDSHPSLQVRLEALGQPLSVEVAQKIALLHFRLADRTVLDNPSVSLT
jgi:hypothetical protein